MPDLTVVPANVAPGVNPASLKHILSDEAIIAGQVIFKKTNGKAGLADANGTDPAPTAIGIACNSAPGANQPVAYVADDDNFTPGATTVAGQPYFLSATPGGIAEVGDLVSGMKSTQVAWGKTGNKLIVAITATGQTIPA
jgi:hypothetical protein